MIHLLAVGWGLEEHGIIDYVQIKNPFTASK